MYRLGLIFGIVKFVPIENVEEEKGEIRIYIACRNTGFVAFTCK